jgi:uncharacterized protein with von Willebrand factor type A (vWA) domain
MVVELRTLGIKRRVMSKTSKDTMLSNHQLRLFDHLLDNEIREKQHLQANAMEHLRNHNIKATWRRSQITWYVEAKNNFALLSGFDIPESATAQQVMEAAQRAERRTRLREPRHRHPTTTDTPDSNNPATGPGPSTTGMVVDAQA